MPEEKVASAATENAPAETEVNNEASANEIDYDAELKAEQAAFERKAGNFEQAGKRVERKNDAVKEAILPDIITSVREEIQSQLQGIIPSMQAMTAENSIQSEINRLTSDPAEQKLIKWHFENSISPNAGDVRSRLESAQAIANKKRIQRSISELSTAQKNRAGLGASAGGSSSEGAAVPDRVLSKDQLASLRARGWDDTKIDMFRKNLLKNRA